MKLPFCVACGAKEDLQHHHLVTRAENGSDNETNLITLCAACHHKMHERQIHKVYNHSERTKDALAAAKARGIIIGGLRDKGRETPGRSRGNAPRLCGRYLRSSPSSDTGLQLNERGIATPNGRPWSAVTVTRVRQRLARP